MAPRYRLRERTYIKPDRALHASLHEVGAEIVYSGTPGRTWEPLNDEARAALAAFEPLSVSAQNILPRRGQAPNPNLPATSSPPFTGTNSKDHTP